MAPADTGSAKPMVTESSGNLSAISDRMNFANCETMMVTSRRNESRNILLVSDDQLWPVPFDVAIKEVENQQDEQRQPQIGVYPVPYALAPCYFLKNTRCSIRHAVPSLDDNLSLVYFVGEDSLVGTGVFDVHRIRRNDIAGDSVPFIQQRKTWYQDERKQERRCKGEC